MKSLASLLFLVLLTVNVYAHEPIEQDHVKVVGVGEVEKEPDQATLNISIEAKEPDLITAKKVADDKYRKVLEVIKKAGIADKHIKATRINAQPEYEWRNNSRIYKGERVSRSLAVTIEDLDLVSKLMQDVIEGGVSRIDGMQTGFKDPKALQELALAAAADDAKHKAEFLAKRLGRNLGDAYSITEHNVNAARPVHRGMAMSADMAVSARAAAPPPPDEMFGSQKVRATVNVSFGLL